MTASARALIFGGTGGIGQAVAVDFRQRGYELVCTSRAAGGEGVLALDPFGDDAGAAFDRLRPLDAVVWAQGANRNDSILDVEVDAFEEVLRANVTFVVATMAELLRRDLLVEGARLCVVSSIWQLLARQTKLSYTVSKSALAGLVRSAAVDLAPKAMLVNAVLPGVVDTSMTRAMLQPEQLAAFEQATGFGRLVQLEDVTSLIGWLCSEQNNGVTGQSIAVDLGYTSGRIV